MDQRSEWIRDDGQGMFVWSIPMAPGETEDLSVATLKGEIGEERVVPTVIGGFTCIRTLEVEADKEGETFLWVRWMIFDSEFEDVHILASSVEPGGVEALESEVNQLVRNASWITAEF